jgi:hypothetical protein
MRLAFRRPHIAAMVLTVLLLSLSSCSDGRPKRFAVTGEVTYRGQPVNEAQVMFMPKGGRPALGVTDAEGRFTVTSFTVGDGAVCGEHIVCVSKTVPDPNGDPKLPYARTLSVLPQRYASYTSSPLKATVTASGPNDFHFDVTD